MDQGQTGQPVGEPPRTGAGSTGGMGTGGGFNQDMSRQIADLRRGFNFGDFMTFRYMITPALITFIYILAVIVITLGALAELNQSVLAAILLWIFAMLWVRVVFEVMIVLFRINDGIQTMARQR
jgi:hypothetical protein